jgi:serine/threonine protein kinase
LWIGTILTMDVPERIGRYEIVAEIGRGAMGSVFKARDPVVGRIVALKTIHSAALAGDQSLEYRARFQREARASGVLAHPGIVPVFDVGEDEGAPFLVMEFVDGRTLADAMKKGERFSLDRVCDIGQQIAEALGYAHRQGVIHRDIKPANVLLTSREVYGSERPRITDFGIAKLAASEITTHGQLLGTPSFMPPEQFTGTPVDGRADLFSLGVILYSLATGEQPFAGETMTAVSYKVVYTEPIPPSKLNPAVSPRLQAAILKCLAKNPAERFQTGEEVAQELQANRFNLGATANPAAPASPLDADATLGPAQAGVTTASLPPGAVTTHPSGTAPIPNTAQTNPASATGAGTGSGTGTGQKRKPVPVETVFALVLLAIAGLGIAIAGGWFTFQHLLNLAMHKHQQASAPITQPVQPVVTIPQVNTTPPPDQTQTNGAQTNPAQTNGAQTSGSPANGTQPATPAAGAPPASAPGPTTGPAGKAPQPAPAKKTAATPASPPAKPSAGKSKSSAQATPPPAQSQAAANTGAAPTPPASSQPAPSPAAAAASSAAASAAATAFNPRKLDPNSSTKLKIELSKLPSGLPVNVNMNRKPYLSFVTGDKTDLENLYVPAGVQEFRVVIKSGGQEFDSKGISGDFKAKKKKTLRIELMQNGVSLPNATVPLPKDAQVFASFPFILGDVL